MQARRKKFIVMFVKHSGKAALAAFKLIGLGLLAVLVLLAALGCGFHLAVRVLRRVLVPWHASVG